MFSLITQVARSCTTQPKTLFEHKTVEPQEEEPKTNEVTAGNVASAIAGCFDSLGVVACIIVGTLVLIPHTHTLIVLSNTHAIIIMASCGGGQLIFTIVAVRIHRHQVGKTNSLQLENDELAVKNIGPFTIEKITFNETNKLQSISKMLNEWDNQANKNIKEMRNEDTLVELQYPKQIYKNAEATINLIQEVIKNETTKINGKDYQHKNMEIYTAKNQEDVVSICVIDKSQENQVEVVLLVTRPNDLHNPYLDKKPGIGAGTAVLYGAVKNYSNSDITLDAKTSATPFYEKLGFITRQKDDGIALMQLKVEDRQKLEKYVRKKF